MPPAFWHQANFWLNFLAQYRVFTRSQPLWFGANSAVDHEYGLGK